jgi:hypothetical protein
MNHGPQQSYQAPPHTQAPAGHQQVKQALSIQDKDTAKKMAKQAISALNFDDGRSAVDALNKAIAVLLV